MNLHEYNDRVKENNRIDTDCENLNWNAISDAHVAIQDEAKDLREGTELDEYLKGA